MIQKTAKIGYDCLEYLDSKDAEKKNQESTSDETDRCEQKFVIDMSSVGFNMF